MTEVTVCLITLAECKECDESELWKDGRRQVSPGQKKCKPGTVRNQDTEQSFPAPPGWEMWINFSPMAQQPLVDQYLLIIEALWSHSDTPHTVGFLSMSDLPYRVLYLTTHNTHKRQDIHAPGRIRTLNLSKWEASDVGLRLRKHWDWCE